MLIFLHLNLGMEGIISPVCKFARENNVRENNTTLKNIHLGNKHQQTCAYSNLFQIVVE